MATLICIVYIVNGHWLNYQGEATICNIMVCGTAMQYPNLSGSIFPQHYYSKLEMQPPEISFQKSEQSESTVSPQEKNSALLY